MDYRIRVSDYVWAGIAALATVGTLAIVLPVLMNLVRNPSFSRLVAFVVGTIFVAGVSRWIVMGAWRRTVWGAPSGGVREVREQRLRRRDSDRS